MMLQTCRNNLEGEWRQVEEVVEPLKSSMLYQNGWNFNFERDATILV
jgi:hypothetical protein